MTWTIEQHKEFAALAEQTLRKNVPGFAALDGQSLEECQQMWTMALWAFKPEIEGVEPLAADSQLQSFIKILLPYDMEKRITVSAKIGRNYGAEYIEFGLTSLSTPGQPAIKAVNDALIKTVLSEHDAYASQHLPNVPRPAGASSGNGNGNGKSQGSTVMVDEGSHIDFEAKAGKRMYSIKCGRWQKFGVRIWPETLAAAGINEADIGIEGLDIGAADIHYVMKPDGQYPDKVVKIERR